MASRWELGKMSDEVKFEVVLRRMGEGAEEEEVRNEVGVGLEVWGEFRKRAFEWAAEELKGKSSEEVFVEYMVEQRRCIEDLKRMARRFDNAKHYTALVGSVKVRSEIYDKIIKRGQEFGILEKAPDRKEIVAGVTVRNMGMEEMRDAVIGELKKLEGVMRDVDGVRMKELEVGEVYREKKGGKRKRRKRG